ncbi:hypothetical protein HK102_005786 [Quaeritorhiza haematococci]|nr:hypothetical protein HK102_005786 [Quaeritorhiza haematococci]
MDYLQHAKRITKSSAQKSSRQRAPTSNTAKASSSTNIGSASTNSGGSSAGTEKTVLDSVVSSLVRAAVGGDASQVSDLDLDKYVADLILKESANSQKKYNEMGIRAYLESQKPNLPKPNKRFLSTIIQSTDDHNKALLRQIKEESDKRLEDLFIEITIQNHA